MVNELPQRNRNRIDKTGVDFLGEKEKSAQINHIGTVIGRGILFLQEQTAVCVTSDLPSGSADVPDAGRHEAGQSP